MSVYKEITDELAEIHEQSDNAHELGFRVGEPHNKAIVDRLREFVKEYKKYGRVDEHVAADGFRRWYFSVDLVECIDDGLKVGTKAIVRHVTKDKRDGGYVNVYLCNPNFEVQRLLKLIG